MTHDRLQFSPRGQRIFCLTKETRRWLYLLGSWCGKKFRRENVAARESWSHVPAVRDGQLFEIKSADSLQHGCAEASL